ncbi:MAG: succinate CoA transferase [Alicyclobacillaceae bacterium]|nr:succinate CoA transferase [Alicyclobacillaceae bacterium]
MTAEEAAEWIRPGMVIAVSGFARAGEARAVIGAWIERRRKEEGYGQIDLFTGASLTDALDGELARLGLVRKRVPFQANPDLRAAINRGDVLFVDEHLSHMKDSFDAHVWRKPDLAILDAVAVREEGIIPTTSVGNSALFARLADKLIIEWNEGQPESLIGMHDIYDQGTWGQRRPIPLSRPDERIGTDYIPIDWSKVVAVVRTHCPDRHAALKPADAQTEGIAGHLLEFLKHEVKAGRLPDPLPPLQAGIGAVSNAVFDGFLQSNWSGLTVYSEVIQDSTFDLFDSGQLSFASASAVILSQEGAERIYPHLDRYHDKILLRPQDISNSPEIIRRLGVIALNTALEIDIYGNVNSTHVVGTDMMNGIGGSGDFSRHARLSIFMARSTVKNGTVSSIVPMVSHTDHTEHEVDVVVTEHGLADLRGLAPRERAPLIIERCADPAYRDELREYYKDALKRGGHTPHVLERAFFLHERYLRSGSMKRMEEQIEA